MRQIAKRYKIRTCQSRKDLKGFVEIENGPQWWRPRIRSKSLSRDDIKLMSKNEIDNYLKKFNFNSYNLVLPSSLLGDFYNLFTFTPPSELFKVSNRTSLGSNYELYRVAIHFRGKDFYHWNPKAVLSKDYYMNAIDVLESDLGTKDVRWSVHTDDPDLESYLAVCKRLKLTNTVRNAFEDFFSLNEAPYIISSPSTFAIWAAILNPKIKRVYHSKAWVKERAEKEDKFWIEVFNETVLFYPTKLV